MENKIKTLQKSYDGLGESVASSQAQVDSLAEQVEKLQQKVIYLETLLNNSKYSPSDTLKAYRDIKITHSGNLLWKEKSRLIWQKMIPKQVPSLGKLEIQLLRQEILNQKASHMPLKLILRPAG